MMPADNTNQIESMEASMGKHSLTREECAQRLLRDDLAKKLDRILHTAWDPIGVHHCLTPRINFIMTTHPLVR